MIHYTASVTDQYIWNNDGMLLTDEKRRIRRKLSQCHSPPPQKKKFHREWPGIEIRASEERDRRLTAWAMTWRSQNMQLCTTTMCKNRSSEYTLPSKTCDAHPRPVLRAYVTLFQPQFSLYSHRCSCDYLTHLYFLPMGWVQVVQDRVQWQKNVNAIINPRFRQQAVNVLAGWAAVSFQKGLLHGVRRFFTCTFLSTPPPPINLCVCVCGGGDHPSLFVIFSVWNEEKDYFLSLVPFKNSAKLYRLHINYAMAHLIKQPQLIY